MAASGHFRPIDGIRAMSASPPTPVKLMQRGERLETGHEELMHCTNFQKNQRQERTCDASVTGKLR